MNYYKSLNVSPEASTADIKSAYRRLARKIHPDLNEGNEDASKEFALIAEAYKVLGNPSQRAEYDKQRLREEYNSIGNDSVFGSENPHAKRARQMAYERRYNAIIDRMIADERRESLAMQKILFPIVALFTSTIFVGIVKPQFWTNSGIFGRITLLTLFLVGLLHLLRRLFAGFERYTYTEDNIQDSLLEDLDEESRPFSRISAVSFLVIGLFLSIGIGLLIGKFMSSLTSPAVSRLFSENLSPEFVFYPPIAVLLVDLLHSFSSRFEA